MDKAYYFQNSFARILQNIGIGTAQLSVKEWAFIRRIIFMNIQNQK